ncbi:MAG: hypothetical protein ACE366_04580, partial [Bradymonadia bacterium]
TLQADVTLGKDNTVGRDATFAAGVQSMNDTIVGACQFVSQNPTQTSHEANVCSGIPVGSL